MSGGTKIENIQEIVFQSLWPGCFYRVADVARELRIGTGRARYALVHLVRGGVITCEKRNGDRINIYLTRQERLIKP